MRGSDKLITMQVILHSLHLASSGLSRTPSYIRPSHKLALCPKPNDRCSFALLAGLGVSGRVLAHLLDTATGIISGPCGPSPSNDVMVIHPDLLVVNFGGMKDRDRLHCVLPPPEMKQNHAPPSLTQATLSIVAQCPYCGTFLTRISQVICICS